MFNRKPDEKPAKDESKPTNPRGEETLNTPESDAPITPPSQKRPYNPSDEIEHQIEASDARTKAPGNEFEKWSDEQVKDYAVKLGIDGNDGLSRNDIIAKIQSFQNKRMFPSDNGNFVNDAKTKREASKQLDDQTKALEDEAKK